jgi:hypothetical protein
VVEEVGIVEREGMMVLVLEGHASTWHSTLAWGSVGGVLLER